MQGTQASAVYATGKSESGWDWCKVYLFLGGDVISQEGKSHGQEDAQDYQED
jgi:hypothetical protein